MYSLHDWENVCILADGQFVTIKHARGIGVNAQNIEATAQMEKKKPLRGVFGQ